MSLGIDPKPSEWASIGALIKDPREYWDFPTTTLAFGKSLGTSRLENVNGAFFRCRGTQATLINWFCSSEQLKDTIGFMKKKYKIKSLNWAKSAEIDWCERGLKVPEFKVEGLYSFEEAISKHSGKTRNTLKRKVSRGSKQYAVIDMERPNRREMTELFQAWVDQASKRHFMVVKGHYEAYIDLLYKGYAQCLTFWDGDVLQAVCGYESWRGKAQITLMKNRPGESFFPIFFWVETLRRLSFKYKEVFCGSTAEELKRMLGFEEYPSWKLKL